MSAEALDCRYCNIIQGELGPGGASWPWTGLESFVQNVTKLQPREEGVYEMCSKNVLKFFLRLWAAGASLATLVSREDRFFAIWKNSHQADRDDALEKYTIYYKTEILVL